MDFFQVAAAASPHLAQILGDTPGLEREQGLVLRELS